MHSRVCFGIYFVHNKPGRRPVQAREAQNPQWRGPFVGNVHTWVRELLRDAQDILGKVSTGE